jgi:redox-regulated HSP33 family molecular chaperone
MIKKDIFNQDVKARFKAAAKDQLYRFVMADSHIKGAVAFFCRCSRNRMQGHLKNLSPDVRADILENGPFPLEIRCHHCNSAYRFTRETLRQVLG